MMNADNVSFYNEYQKFRDYVLYADTSFWVELADQPDAQCRLRSFLQRSGKTVQVPRVVLDELNHLMSIPEKAARAAGAQRLLGELEHGRMLTFFGSLDDSISGLLADAVFLAEFERRRVSDDLLLLTQDADLTRDVLDLKNRHSVQSFKKIQVKRLTSNGYLGRVLPMPELPPETAPAAEPAAAAEPEAAAAPEPAVAPNAACASADAPLSAAESAPAQPAAAASSTPMPPAAAKPAAPKTAAAKSRTAAAHAASKVSPAARHRSSGLYTVYGTPYGVCPPCRSTSTRKVPAASASHRDNTELLCNAAVIGLSLLPLAAPLLLPSTGSTKVLSILRKSAAPVLRLF